MSGAIQSTPEPGLSKSLQGSVSQGHQVPFGHILWLMTGKSWVHNRQKGTGSNSERTQWTQHSLAGGKCAGTEVLFRKQIQLNSHTAGGNTQKPTHYLEGRKCSLVMWEGLSALRTLLLKRPHGCVSMLSPLSKQPYLEAWKVDPSQSPKEIPENWSHQKHEWELLPVWLAQCTEAKRRDWLKTPWRASLLHT